MAKLLRRKKRVLRSSTNNQPLSKLPERPVYSTASQRVLALPQYRHLKVQLQKGVSIPKIVTWFDREGWLGTMSPSTLTQYLYKFKTECAHLYEQRPDEVESYEYHVGTSIPDVDELGELDKLILAQKRRVSIEMKLEVGMSKLLEGTHKEVKVLGELLAIRAQMSGKTSTDTASSGDTATTLRNLRVDESERDRMQELTVQLIQGVKNGSRKKITKTKSIRA